MCDETNYENHERANKRGHKTPAKRVVAEYFDTDANHPFTKWRMNNKFRLRA